MTNCIFDFDGVLARTMEEHVALRRDCFNELGSDEEITKRQRDYFAKPKHSRKNDLSQEQKDNILKSTQQYAEYMLESQNTIFDEFFAEITKLNARKSIVSSNSEAGIRGVLKDKQNMFDHILGIETSLSKEDKIEIVCDSWQVDSKEVIYITDTVSDVLEVSELIGLNNVYGCAWGWSGIDALSKVLPENQILNHFNDMKVLVD
ncbi:MAG: HAD-IA family hydrolase [Patescibacteria group bacterium]